MSQLLLSPIVDRKTRKFLTLAKIYHPKANVNRLYIRRKAGGRGRGQLATKTTTIALNTYLNNKGDYLLKIARDHDREKKTIPIHHQAAKYGRELTLPEALEQLKSKWKEKPLYG